MASTARVGDVPQVLADPRVPAPGLDGSRLECGTRPDRWLPDSYGKTVEYQQAVRACGRCPQRKACLLYALANPELARDGIWAATNPGHRRLLLVQLRDRLGEDWVGVVTGKPATTD